MNKITLKSFTILLTAFIVSGCYNAKVVTGETASSEVYQEKWAASWIGGLVPPEVVNVEKECSNGVAIVETKHSFLNLLVGGLTAGIFTPMQITVTCAETSTALTNLNVNPISITIPKDSSEQDFMEEFQKAVDQSSANNKPVIVIF